MTGVSASSIRAVPPFAAPGVEHGSPVPASTVAMFLNSGRSADAASILVPAGAEIWFSSSTALPVAPRSFAAAGDVLARLIAPGRDDSQTLNIKYWFDRLRSRLVDRFGIPDAEAVLVPCGAQAGYLAARLAQGLLARPLSEIIVGPSETERGDMRLNGCETQAIAIRDAAGYPRDPAAINRAYALAAGRDVLLHVLDASQTGLAGMTREAARALADQAPGRIAIIVHACPFRSEPARLHHDLEAGCMVAITDSQFAGGASFAGALLLPPAIVGRLRLAPRLIAEFGVASARFDWPEVLRDSFAAELDTPVNLGLGLRWEAAFAVIEPYLALPQAFRRQILTWFAGAVHRRVAARPHLRQIAGEPSRSKTITPIETLGPAATLAGAALLHAGLAAPQAPFGAPQRLTRACHLGRPVQIGARAALRVCASMPMVLDIAGRVAQGSKIEAAVAPVTDDLDVLFEKWDWLAAG